MMQVYDMETEAGRMQDETERIQAELQAVQAELEAHAAENVFTATRLAETEAALVTANERVAELEAAMQVRSRDSKLFLVYKEAGHEWCRL